MPKKAQGTIRGPQSKSQRQERVLHGCGHSEVEDRVGRSLMFLCKRRKGGEPRGDEITGHMGDFWGQREAEENRAVI